MTTGITVLLIISYLIYFTDWNIINSNYSSVIPYSLTLVSIFSKVDYQSRFFLFFSTVSVLLLELLSSFNLLVFF
jgi:hypothetical protein